MHAELCCTYRLQLSPRFTLADATQVVDYLSALGLSHVYLSPVLQAGSDSEHGYDVTDPTRIRVELGGREALDGLFDRLRECGMAAVLDIVPNHQSATTENPWWCDVLRAGPSSRFAGMFDIDWDPPDRELQGKVLWPVLGDHLGRVLENGEITLHQNDQGDAWLQYAHIHLPLNDASRGWIRDGGRDIGTLLQRQYYRLAFWRLGPDEVNYRRFFDITSLVGVRVESPEVFHATHDGLLDLLRAGPVDGVRVDHPDGLRDPAGYLHLLGNALGEAWRVVEKILATGESLPPAWPVDGTTGYDFLQRVGGLFINPDGEKPISDFYADFTGHTTPYAALVREQKRRVLEQSFDGDLRRLVESFREICLHPALRLDYSRRLLRDLLGEVLVSFPVYRTYVNAPRGEVSPQDREAIRSALASTRRREDSFDEALLELLERTLCGELDEAVPVDDFIARFQQLTGPLMAKGLEDTTFYRYDRLLALNDVGCDPARFGVSVQAFHEDCLVAQRQWPRSMLATSTHDTKRSEDVRARLALLSEMADPWAEQVRIWSQHNRPAWRGREPDRSAEHMFYQTLVGAWPIERERLAENLHKACREAKARTSWTQPDETYESGIRDFMDAVLDDAEFMRMLEAFVGPLVPLGRVNSLAQTLIKLTAPGVPDIYQGCELWDNSLVDPDNRRPVDYAERRRLLAWLEASPSAAQIMARGEEGLPKLYVIRQCLALRGRKPLAFGAGQPGSYQPLLVSGQKLKHVVAFNRGGVVAVIAPRLVHTLAGDWQDTRVELGAGDWHHLLDDTHHTAAPAVGDLLKVFPVALLELQS